MRDRQLLLGLRDFARVKTQPLNFKILSDSYAFSIDPLVLLASGRILVIKVQDIQRNIFFTRENGVWDNAPKVAIGVGKLYISAWAINEGEAGLTQLLIKDDAGAILAVKQETVAAGGNLGVETGTIDMPDRNYGILITVEP